MLVLDTDHLSFLFREDGAEGIRLRSRLDAAGGERPATTIVTYEEQTRGWLAHLSDARTMSQVVARYSRFSEHIEAYRSIKVLEFDHPSGLIFGELQAARIRIGTMDLKIASIVLSLGGTLLSRNLVDFRKVPNLQVEDWTT